MAPKQNSQGTTVYSTSTTSTPVVVKDVAGNTRDVDEYNRRYTSRENTFSMQNDTLYIQEKPYGERGEWVNGFEGSQDDYEYAMRIVRFRSPRYAIPVSSPLYWDVVYGAFPSWDWNVYDDGLYAYVFPTYSNPLWWDWRWNWSIAGPRYSFGWGWSSPWYYSSWILHIGMAVTGVAIGEATGPVTGDRGGIIIIRTIRRMDGEEDGMVILIPTITAVQRMWYGEVLWALYSTIMAELEVV